MSTILEGERTLSDTKRHEGTLRAYALSFLDEDDLLYLRVVLCVLVSKSIPGSRSALLFPVWRLCGFIPAPPWLVNLPASIILSGLSVQSFSTVNPVQFGGCRATVNGIAMSQSPCFEPSQRRICARNTRKLYAPAICFSQFSPLLFYPY